MQVLLHPDIDIKLLVIDKSKYGYSDPGFTIDKKFLTYKRVINASSGEFVTIQEKAVYDTGKLPLNPTHNLLDRSGYTFNTVCIRKDYLPFPQDAEYCVIQNLSYFLKYYIQNIDIYPIGEYIEGIYPTLLIKEFLQRRNDKYGGEQNYKIIQKQVLLVRAVGCENITTDKFQKLLLVDSEVLEKEVNRLIELKNITLYSCSFTERPELLDELYRELVSGTPDPFVMEIQMAITTMEKYLKRHNEIDELRSEVARLTEENKKYKDIIEKFRSVVNDC